MKRFEKVIADAINEALAPMGPVPPKPLDSAARLPGSVHLLGDEGSPSTRRAPVPPPARLKPLVFDTRPIG